MCVCVCVCMCVCVCRIPHPWDSPGKNTGVGCHFLLQCMKVESESEVAQLYPTLSDPMDCSLPGSSIHEILQARVLEWGAIAFSDCSFIEIQFIYHIIHPLKVYNPVVFSILTDKWNHFHSQFQNNLIISKRNSLYFNHNSTVPQSNRPKQELICFLYL